MRRALKGGQDQDELREPQARPCQAEGALEQRQGSWNVPTMLVRVRI